MCDIAGIYSAKLAQADREAAVARMAPRQAQRGPDDRGFFYNSDLTLGMCRLAIFDPAILIKSFFGD
jgi:asparagine synthase (glutamine-hydrolysing)